MKQIICLIAVLLVTLVASTPTSTTPITEINVVKAQKSPCLAPATADEVPTVATEEATKQQPTSAAATEPPTTATTEEVTEEYSEETMAETMAEKPEIEYYSNEYSYDESDVMLLAQLIYTEAGSEWIPEDIKKKVGSVVINRVNSPLYADSVYGVIHEEGQYPSHLKDDPSPEVIEIAQSLLENGSTLPANVLGQNGEATGSEIYDTYTDPESGVTIYFTYVY